MMMGTVNAIQRNKIYANPSKRIFFMTPQTMENDLEEGRIEKKKIVLIVFGKSKLSYL